MSVSSQQPGKLWAYFQLTRLHLFPHGNILVIWPCLWSLTMAAYRLRMPFENFLPQAIAYVVSSTLVHSTACVLNDICDVDFDRQGKRTKVRPLAAGTISLVGAWTLLVLMTTACVYAVWFLNSNAMLLGLFGLFPLHGLYPLMKRWIWWPQVWLGFAMNWGYIVVWMSLLPDTSTGDLTLLAVMLTGCICWTVVYDTIYASQDRQDDLKTGAKSMTIVFGDRIYGFLTCFAICFVLCLVRVGQLNAQHWPFFIISCGGTALHLIWQLTTWNNNDGDSCRAKFQANGDLGFMVWAGILLDYHLCQTN